MAKQNQQNQIAPPQATIRKYILQRRKRKPWTEGQGFTWVVQRSQTWGPRCPPQAVPLQTHDLLCWNSHPDLMQPCDKFTLQPPHTLFSSCVRNKESRKERWNVVSNFWRSSNVKLFTFQWEWENYILPCQARLQYFVQHICVANLSFYIVNIRTLYTKFNSASNLTSLVLGTLHYVRCIFIAKNIFAFLHVLLLGFFFISLRACLRW